MRSGVIGPSHESRAVSPGVVDAGSSSRADKLRRFMQAYWLRPENALWMTLRSDALDRCSLDAPMLDIACGDGAFMFLHGGGMFDPSFDVFQAVGKLDRVRDEHADMFDVATDDYNPPISSPARLIVSHGMDVKRRLLTKASRLGLYEQLTPHDANDPLPLRSESVRTVYCNAAYWIKNVEAFLRELRRVVQSDGKVILHVKLDTIRSCTLERDRHILGDRFLDIIGRGRFATWPSLTSRAEWERRFVAAGLYIAACVPLATQTHAHLWDVGLRPLAPMLVRMANELSAPTRREIKKQWVDTMLELTEPLHRFDLGLSSGGFEAVELQYVLTAA